jgi:hypothetical protein
LLDRAQRAGAVRDDVRLPEVYALILAACRAAGQDGNDAVRAPMLAIVFDGLSPRH